MGTIVDEFIARYRREQDFYEQAARLVAQALEARLQAEGLRAIVTQRAKNAGRLLGKVQERNKTKQYPTVESIYEDLVDLAGVRIALYFPGQQSQAGRLVEEIFTVTKRKDFPDGAPPKYAKRFSGYSATHYHVRLKDSLLSETQKRYADARVEVQVASVLMHAWAEVEHDLVYKPLQGELSIDEYAVLDELNGLVLAGELALERLQRAGEQRVAEDSRTLANHYELASHLLHEVSKQAPGPLAHEALGRVDLLFDLLTQLDIRRPELLAPYLRSLNSDFESRQIAEQVIDRLLAEDPARYAAYERIQLAQRDGIRGSTSADAADDVYAAIGMFIAEWTALETFVRERAPRGRGRMPVIPTARLLEEIAPTLSQSVLHQFERVRRRRNALVHGLEPANVDELNDNAAFLRLLREQLEAIIPPPIVANADVPESERVISSTGTGDAKETTELPKSKLERKDVAL